MQIICILRNVKELGYASRMKLWLSHDSDSSFWDMTPCRLVKIYHNLTSMYYLRLRSNGSTAFIRQDGVAIQQKIFFSVDY